MALVVKDRVKQTTTTTGTGTLTLNGTVDGFQTFAAALSDGDTTYYALLEPSTNSWEVGLGTWTESTTTLARTTILESSNAGSAVSLTAQSEVFITQPADKAVYYDANGDITPTGNVDVAGTLDVTGAATFDDSVTIQGDLTINGTTTTVSATNLAIEDNMIYLNDGSTTTNPDLGWAGNYNDGTYAHAGVFRDASDGTFKLYDGYTPEPGTAIDTTHASFTLAPLDTGALSVEGNITVTGTVDGRDIASDGSKLDGIEAGATGDQSASEILTAVKTVDGSGSGLDADLLDGQQGSYYLDWTHVTNKPDPSVTLSGDVSGSATMTNLGSINITTTVANDSHTHDSRYYTETEVGNFFSGSTSITGYNKSNWDTAFGWGNHASANYLAASSYTAADVLTKIKTVDGSGSGLDADLLDGTSLFNVQQGIQATALTSSDDLDTITTNGHYRWTSSVPTNAPSNTYHNMTVLSDGSQPIQMVWGGSGSGAADIHIRRRDSGTWQSWTTFWNSGNDGAGSGLDADLLDGQHGSYYLDWTNTTNKPDPTLTLNGDVSGSATFTNLGNATLSVTVANDSHTHDGRYYTETEADSRFVNVTGDTMSGDLTIANNDPVLSINDTNNGNGGGFIGHIAFNNTSGESFRIGDWAATNETGGPDILRLRNSNGTRTVFEWGQAGTTAGSLYAYNQRVFADDYHPNADKWTTARTLSLSGDASGSVSWDGSANATLSVTVADDSHNHVISNVDGLQTALDGKLSTSGKAADSNLLDGIDSSAFLRSNANDTSSGTIAFGTGAIDPDGYTAYSGGFGSITDGSGWSARGVFVHGGGTGDAAALAVAGDVVYLGSQSGTAANTMGTIFSVPHSTKAVNFATTPNVSGSNIWHSGNDGAGSGLDADLWDGNQFSDYLNQGVRTVNSPSFAGLNINGSLNAVDDIYLASALYHEGDTNTSLSFSTDVIALTTGGTSRVYIDNTGVRLGDSGNGYFQPVSGNYGSIQIDGGAHGGYEGYSIGGRVVLMHDNGVVAGLYNDVSNEWLFRADLDGSTQLYHDGSSKLQTTISGVNIDGDLNAVDHIYLAGNMYHEGDTNTYIGFHAADEWRVVTGGTERLEVNSTRTQIDRLLVSSALAENYSALSGTTPTADPDNGGAFSLTMTGNTTFTFGAPALGSVSTGFILQLTGNGGTVTWPASVKWAGGTAPDAPASGETDILVFHTRDGGTNWYGVLSSDAAA